MRLSGYGANVSKICSCTQHVQHTVMIVKFAKAVPGSNQSFIVIRWTKTLIIHHSGEGNVALYATPYPFHLNNQTLIINLVVKGQELVPQ